MILYDSVCSAVSRWSHESDMILETNIVPPLTIEISKIVASGGSMHASVKLEGIDGRAPQDRVEHVA